MKKTPVPPYFHVKKNKKEAKINFSAFWKKVPPIIFFSSINDFFIKVFSKVIQKKRGKSTIRKQNFYFFCFSGFTKRVLCAIV